MLCGKYIIVWPTPVYCTLNDLSRKVKVTCLPGREVDEKHRRAVMFDAGIVLEQYNRWSPSRRSRSRRNSRGTHGSLARWRSLVYLARIRRELSNNC